MNPGIEKEARSAVRRELLHAAGSACLAPARILAYLFHRSALRAELLDALEHPAVVEDAPPPAPSSAALDLERQLSFFISCAEPSGELHAVNLVRALRAELAELGATEPRFAGLGSQRLADEGVEVIGDPVSRAAMGADVLKALPFYTELLRRVRVHVQTQTHDAAVLVDSPALHVPVARLIRGAGVPVAHFATPQYWGWAPWRVAGYRKAVDLAMTILPFEPPWFRARGVRTAHVGHPLLDELEDTTPSTAEPGLLALLPGSREGVVRRNLPWMLGVLEQVRRDQPNLRITLPVARDELRRTIEGIVEAHGASSWVTTEADLHACLSRARAAFSVSGTVLIDLLMRNVPAVVIYRLARPIAARLTPWALTVPWFSSVNLLAGREVFPEFTFAGEGPQKDVVEAINRSLNDNIWRESAHGAMETARERLGPPGATRRAARHVIHLTRET